MISGRRMLLMAAPILAYLLFVGCKSSSSSPTAVPTQRIGASATAQPVGGASGSAEKTFDIELTGGPSAHWKTGDTGTGANCTVASDGYAAFGVYGQIDGKPYALGYSQNQYAAGTYAYPTGRVSGIDEPPFIQVGTTTDSSVDWTAAAGGLGSGTAKVTGDRDSSVDLEVDLELTARASGAPVHVKGTLHCPAA